MKRTYRLVTASPDRTGIIARVTNLIASYNGWISDAGQHSDPESGWFFSRQEIRADSLPFDVEAFRELFEPVAREFSMEWFVRDSALPHRVALMASKESHCLADLLHRWQSGELDCEIPCVISNHTELKSMVEWYGIPFHHLPVDSQNRAAAFASIEKIWQEYEVDTVVLARYMQILPPELCARMRGNIINIHHSFLPSFAGARPYHQASERGVKLIGATCHYVTRDLDAGPIIEQDVVRITHRDTLDDLVRKGKDCEKMVLARGLRSHLQDKVVIHGNKTIVFD